MPLCGVKSEPVGKTVQTCHFTNSDAAGIGVMDRARTSECTSCRISSGTKCVAETVRGKFVEARNRLNLARFRCRKLSLRDRSVYRSEARCEDARIPSATIAVVPTMVSTTTHIPGIRAGGAKSPYQNSILFEQLFEPVRIGQIAKCIAAGWPHR